MNDNYRVCVRGLLDDRWSGWLGDFAVQRQDDGTTTLIGPVGDQAALYGVIGRVRDLGLALLSVNRELEANTPGDSRSEPMSSTL